MLKFSVCIEMIFRDQPIEKRIAKTKECGADAFEFWGYANKDVDLINRVRKDVGIPVAAMSSGSPPIVDAANKAKYVDAVKAAIDVAHKLECKTLLQTTGNEIVGTPRQKQHAAIVECLKAAAPLAEKAGIMIVLEPLNILVNHKGYYLDKSSEGFEILREVGSKSVTLLYDIYHQQITEGNIIDTISANIGQIGHFHMGDVPGRHEPGTGELNYRGIFKKIAEKGYGGYVGMEFSPTCDHAEAVKATLALGR